MLLEVTLLADEDSAESLADALLGAGALSVAIEDADAASDLESPLFGEPGFEPERQAWQRSRLRILLEGNQQDSERLIAAAAAPPWGARPNCRLNPAQR